MDFYHDFDVSFPNDIEHFFMCLLLAICIASFERYTFEFFVHLKNLVVFLSHCVLYMCWTESHIWFSYISPHHKKVILIKYSLLFFILFSLVLFAIRYWYPEMLKNTLGLKYILKGSFWMFLHISIQIMCEVGGRILKSTTPNRRKLSKLKWKIG